MIDYSRIREMIDGADAILVGASNGLSITEGLHIFADNDSFRETFGDFRERYGLRNILDGMFLRWPSDEERWAFYARLAKRYSLDYKGSKVMDSLKKLLDGKDYFIVTSNGENHFELAGFDADRILEIEGSWKEMCCAKGCHDTRYPTWEMLAKMADAERNGRVPSEMVPRCPHCGAPMTICYRPTEKAMEAYSIFVHRNHGRRLLVLELGIGARNQLIKRPLMELVAEEPRASYITFNKGELYIPTRIASKSIGVDGDLGEILPRIAGM